MLRMIGIRDIDELYPVLALTEKYDIAGHINTGREFTAVETRTDTRVRGIRGIHNPLARVTRGDIRHAITDGDLPYPTEPRHLSEQLRLQRLLNVEHIKVRASANV